MPDDLEKHVQLNRARLTPYFFLREEIKTYCECRGHAARNAEQKGSSNPGSDDPMDMGAFGKGKGKQGKGKHGKGNGKGKQGKDETGVRTRTRTRIRLNVGIVESANTIQKTFNKNTNKGGSKGKHKSKNATDAHNLDSTKPANFEPEVEIGGFDTSILDVDALQRQESERIKIGVDTGAGKTARPQSHIREEASWSW